MLKEPMNPSFLTKIIGLILLGLVVTFIIDPMDPSTISTPFMLGIVLMGLSLRQDAPLVAVASLVYSILTVYALITAQHYFHIHVQAQPHPYFWLFQRMGLFLVTCGLAIYLAHYRTISERNLAHIQNILGKLPVPVVISDAAGYIAFVNDALVAAFKDQAAGLVGKRYIDFFMPDIQEGKAVRYYIELFEGQENGIHEHEVRPFGGSSQMIARLTCLGVGTRRVMITALIVAAPKF
jgi:PAS domain-containing protein